jgi:hypothetical protein
LASARQSRAAAAVLRIFQPTLETPKIEYPSSRTLPVSHFLQMDARQQASDREVNVPRMKQGCRNISSRMGSWLLALNMTRRAILSGGSRHIDHLTFWTKVLVAL